jgi:hypothetical protein
MDASGIGGLIRLWELKSLRIRHVLVFGLPSSRLKHGPVWPSSKEDYWGFRDYGGNVPIGTLIAIPPTVDVAALHLSRSGQALAQALQNYGAYCDDTAGTSNLVFYAEQIAEGSQELREMRDAIQVLHPYLRAVTNNAPRSRGGGGVPKVPVAPALAN